MSVDTFAALMAYHSEWIENHMKMLALIKDWLDKTTKNLEVYI